MRLHRDWSFIEDPKWSLGWRWVDRGLMAALLLALVLGPHTSFAAQRRTPVVNDSRLELTLIAQEPEIVTPIGLAIDGKGRLFVLESHTHFPKSDYPGPKHDRVKLFADGDGDGKPDRASVFADEFHHAMNLAFSPGGDLYLTHRNGVLRLNDQDGNGVSESRQVILTMETPGNYPHNGLGGIAFSSDGWLYVGQGENLGERYILKGSDGSSRSGHGEGGNVFRCRPDGSALELFATGFWNPFGLAFYGREFLLALDNDPDSRPPNRLLDVVKHGDYGFKFRFGRSGLHPFQAWNGELPGTLPMVAGTGEAACALLGCDQTRWPADYREAVLVTGSWDHQIEIYRPKPFGASLRADREVLVKGDDSFRPVALAAAPDGSVYFTDWVNVSYNVHSQGAIWRLAAKQDSAIRKPKPLIIAPNSPRKVMHRLQNPASGSGRTDYLARLADSDPFVRHAAIDALSRSEFWSTAERELKNKSAAVRLGALLALRRAGLTNASAHVGRLMADPDTQVRLMAVIWAGEARMTELTNQLASALSSGPVSPALLRAHVATAKILSSNAKDVVSASPAAITFFDASEPVEESSLAVALESLSSRVPLQARLDAVRQLAQTTNAAAIASLKKLALDRKQPVDLRCEAILSLAGGTAEAGFFLSLLHDSMPAARVEAARALRMHRNDPGVWEELKKKLAAASGGNGLSEQLNFLLSPASGRNSDERAPDQSEADWRTLLAGDADAAAGRRVFFHPAVGCATCHRIEDQGGRLGPDLSAIARGADREKLMHSILNPSRDIAPQFVSHTVETKDGQAFTGLLIGGSVETGVTLFLADGRAVAIPPRQIASHTQAKLSLMPEDLEKALTVQDFRDLMAFLLSRK